MSLGNFGLKSRLKDISQIQKKDIFKNAHSHKHLEEKALWTHKKGIFWWIHQKDSLSDSLPTLPTDQICPLSDPSDPDCTALTSFPCSLFLELAEPTDSAFSLTTTQSRGLSDNLLWDPLLLWELLLLLGWVWNGLPRLTLSKDFGLCKLCSEPKSCWVNGWEYLSASSPHNPGSPAAPDTCLKAKPCSRSSRKTGCLLEDRNLGAMSVGPLWGVGRTLHS